MDASRAGLRGAGARYLSFSLVITGSWCRSSPGPADPEGRGPEPLHGPGALRTGRHCDLLLMQCARVPRHPRGRSGGLVGSARRRFALRLKEPYLTIAVWAAGPLSDLFYCADAIGLNLGAAEGNVFLK